MGTEWIILAVGKGVMNVRGEDVVGGTDWSGFSARRRVNFTLSLSAYKRALGVGDRRCRFERIVQN